MFGPIEYRSGGGATTRRRFLGPTTCRSGSGSLPFGPVLPRRKHHASSGRSLPLVLLSILLIAAVGAGAFALLRRGDENGGAGEEPVPEFTFQLAGDRVSALGDEPREQRRAEAVEAVHALLDELYTVAFVDPAAWQDGGFPDLPALFDGAAADRAVEDLDGLSLGAAAAQVRRVEPRRSRLTISLLFDERSEAIAALAEASFRGRGRTEDGRRLTIEHEGRYLLRRLDRGWRIVGYDVRGELDAASSGAGGEA